jgi:hypothetical protein
VISVARLRGRHAVAQGAAHVAGDEALDHVEAEVHVAVRVRRHDDHGIDVGQDVHVLPAPPLRRVAVRTDPPAVGERGWGEGRHAACAIALVGAGDQQRHTGPDGGGSAPCTRGVERNALHGAKPPRRGRPEGRGART